MGKFCISCGKEMDVSASFCPYCGTRQEAPYEQKNPYQENHSVQHGSMSTNKILSMIALGLALVGVVFGGVFTEIAALVISIIVLCSKEDCKKETRIFAKVALIISIILIIIMFIYAILVGGILLSQLENLQDLFHSFL